MIHPCEANLEKEARTSLKTEGSTRGAGDPRSKMEFAHGRIGQTLVLFVYFIVPAEPESTTVCVISEVNLQGCVQSPTPGF